VAAWCGDAAMIKLLLSAGAILDGGGNGGPLGTLLFHFEIKNLIFFLYFPKVVQHCIVL